MRASTSSIVYVATAALAIVGAVAAPTRDGDDGKPIPARKKRQSYQTHNLTPDGFWHNRYHALLSMAAYGDYNTLCPEQTFTEETLLQNFPNATRPPWDVVSTFGPTPSGCKGFTAIVPEMNKALIIFTGDYQLEQTLPLDVVYFNETVWNGTATALPERCAGCTVNRFAVQGYIECKQETNNWEEIVNAYQGQGLVFSITGHGLGGMHSQIAALDLYEQDTDYYNHAYGAPRTFNSLGSEWYANRFNGEAGERGVAQNDQYTEFIPEGENYSHAGTPFYYWGFNSTSTSMNWRICWLEDNPDYSECMPTDQGTGTTAAQDHYYYFTPVTQCGGEQFLHDNSTTAPVDIDPYINSVSASFTTSAAFEASTTWTVTSTSTAVQTASDAPGASGTSSPDTGSTGAAASVRAPVVAVVAVSLLALAPFAFLPIF